MNNQHDYIFDWNRIKKVSPLSSTSFELVDETLRDGLQSPSATDPTIEQKIELIHLMEALGVSVASLGLPGAGPRAFSDVLALAHEIAASRMTLQRTAAARTTVQDIEPIAEIVQKTGIPIEVYTFIGSSPIRLFAEGWTVDTLLRRIETSVRFAIQEGLEVCLVTEDTTRAKPEVLDPLFRNVIALGVRRLCLCDTVGHVTPDGVRNLFDWTQSLIRGTGVEVNLDWHGHNDRGLAVANALHAIECGARRVHGTGLGVGERVGNASMDQLLVNLKLLGEWHHDLSGLISYCQAVSRAYEMAIPVNYPVAGRDAFRTATGVHAAAVIKAQKKGHEFLADRIYSSVPAGMVGRRQEIEISHMSGASNVAYWLELRGQPTDGELVQAVLRHAKTAKRVLADEEIMEIVRQQRGELPKPRLVKATSV